MSESPVRKLAGRREAAGRDGRLDRLRVVAAVVVVGGHAGSFVVNHVPVWSGAWWPGSAAVMTPRWSVPVFVLISGALLLRGTGAGAPEPLEAERIGAVVSRRLARIGWPLLFWSVLYLGLQLWSGSGDRRITSGGAGGVLDAILLGQPMYHLYYLFIAAGLYLVAPFLQVLVRGLAASGLRVLAVGCLALASLSSLVDWRVGGGGANALTLFVPFIGYFLLGHFLANIRPVRHRGRWLAVGMLAALGCWGGYLLAVLSSSAAATEYAESFLHPVAVLAAVALFAGVTGGPGAGAGGGALAQRLSGLTLGVYLAHPMFVAAIGLVLPHTESLAGGVLSLAVLWAGALFGSTALVLLAERVPVLRKVV
ncbi:acyltransferase [Amycolatopsis cihanbeyliensis]|uniref:acyltransferase n=1 Tax=Amycolatopsis cihanbeyliensis TaxID=1128664 RepID=UPI0014774C10|nr:acyltransferase [Amycolatopsis cihanbeyliensis]